MNNWKAEYIAKLRAEQNPRLLLAASEQCASNALDCAEDPDKQTAALVFSRIATARAIAAVAAAILERPEQQPS